MPAAVSMLIVEGSSVSSAALEVEARGRWMGNCSWRSVHSQVLVVLLVQGSLNDMSVKHQSMRETVAIIFILAMPTCSDEALGASA